MSTPNSSTPQTTSETVPETVPERPHLQPSAQPSLFGDASVDHAVAGFGAGTVATLVMHPLDLVKVRFQLADANAPKHRLGRGVYDALADAVRADGWRGLYRGLIPNLVGGASSWGLYFLFYNMIKQQMQGGDPTYRTTGGQHLLAAAEASAITAMLTNPIWVAKTRIFATPSHDPHAYSGLLNTLGRIYKTEGWRGLYRGSLLALVGVSNGSIQFATYEDLKRRRIDAKHRRFVKAGRKWSIEDEKLSNTEYILASGASKFVAIALTYPYQVVRARIQNGPPGLTIPDVVKQTWRGERLPGFYKGLATNALRILPGTCTTFVVYENLVWLFRKVAARRDRREASREVLA
ncbi:hypothetical protein CcaverHIS002_0601300 [Cutaneotrichosporon cavernicola]|uniref:Mitochondrial carrier n=1 Tax=Cutaneotrichosporon cavernicola TaxID=279322 RepID=A0AA48L5R9_9TREE|nr:uncharacterized protein CcaverHIS019_0501390 [Cutaneotrichosporon cavernicola]BEI85843.1 hypothetical protein CcaverHIS002_0601300 [Cutaneotrichosporon cavernicola]BEI92511.1 hypothetical protein CcaverHIS019_0501390 [Cutaneotrichosporon cavernicola]BEJ00284.1 hypothetical protein CcaverHIS631_0501410 [Cutaneotrichosporon cavernicola]BEJ08054.1 hypothetical protein CcaverHIS641_0501390 [Cutaneotrichosporon cavernicola]